MKAISTTLLVIGGGLFGLGIFMKRILPAENLEQLGGRGVILVAFLFGGLFFGAGFILKQRVDRAQNSVDGSDDSIDEQRTG